MIQQSLSWLKQPISRRVGGLSATLLSFILVLIIYSIITISQISNEMRELAEIDIPLTEAVTEVEVLQLELHLVVEKLRIYQFNHQQQTNSQLLLDKYKQVETRLENHLKQAEVVLDQAISQGLLVDELQQHQKVLAKLKQFKDAQFHFAETAVNTLSNIDLTSSQWSELETRFKALDENIVQLLQEMEQLLEDVALITQQHAKQFMWVNISLGISALILGIYISIYIVASIQRRINHIHDRLSHVKNAAYRDGSVSTVHEKLAENDEFSALNQHIESVIDGFVNELNTRYQVEERLLQLAVTDKLTDAYNRHKWDEMLGLELTLAQRDQGFAIIAVDLDHFKSINDTRGHDVGDAVLKQAVTLMNKHTRETDIVFRLGGEEFVILTRNTDLQQAVVIAEKVRAAFSEFKQQDLPSFTASFGVTAFDAEDSGETLLKRADEALYQAKNNGRNQVVAV
jgi:diguanylate cyclase (GGDEF)-like protein